MLTDTHPSVLIVDDDPGLATVIRLMLDRAGYRVLLAESAQDALKIVRRQRPDAVLLDLMMPDIDGLTLLRQLRAHGATSRLPVIILTARLDEASRRACEAAGATAYLTKPVSRSQLVDQLSQALAGVTIS